MATQRPPQTVANSLNRPDNLWEIKWLLATIYSVKWGGGLYLPPIGASNSVHNWLVVRNLTILPMSTAFFQLFRISFLIHIELEARIFSNPLSVLKQTAFSTWFVQFFCSAKVKAKHKRPPQLSSAPDYNETISIRSIRSQHKHLPGGLSAGKCLKFPSK